MLEKRAGHICFYIRNEVLYEKWQSWGEQTVSTQIVKVKGLADIDECSDDLVKNLIQNKDERGKIK